MNDITTESEITTHPKMLEMTSNSKLLSSRYIVTTTYFDSLSTIVYRDAIKALAYIVVNTHKQKFNITKMIVHIGSDYIDYEYDFPLVSLQQEALIESNLAISKVNQNNG